VSDHKAFEELCAAFAVGALDGADRDKLRAHLPGCSACRQRVAEFEESSTWLALGLEPIQPSAQVKAAVMQRISGGHAAVKKPGGDASLLTYVALGLAGLAIAAAIGMGYLYAQASSDLEAVTEERDSLDVRLDLEQEKGKLLDQLTLTLKENDALVARLRADVAERDERLLKMGEELTQLRAIAALLQDPATKVVPLTKRLHEGAGEGLALVLWKDQQVAVVGANLPRLEPGKAYELWAIAPGGAPQPAGVFADLAPDGTLLGRHQLPANPGDVGNFAISVEPAAGSAAPTTNPILINP
jgi:anti-sigma-K factor RskA